MTGNEFQNAALRTANSYDGDKLLVNGILGLSGETGEVADIVKKHFFQGHELNRSHLAEELGDIAWYLAVTAHAIGYDLDEILQMNVEKLWRRYPEGFDSCRSVHREREEKE